MILGDNKGSPECRRVVFADRPKEGRRLTTGGKYSEVIVARIITEIQVVGDEETRRLRTARRGGPGYIPAESEMNQVFEHGFVILVLGFIGG